MASASKLSWSWDKLSFIPGLAAFAFLVYLSATNYCGPVYDERNSLPNVPLLEQMGFNREFLLAIHHQSPGPLYQIVHAALHPVTGLTAPGIRLVNVFGLALVMMGSYWIISRKQPQSAASTTSAFLGLPMVWPIAGMALTEMPSMVACVAMLIIAKWAHEKRDLPPLAFLVSAFFAGCFLSLAIMGRSMFLVGVLALPFLAGWPFNRRAFLWGALTAVFALPFPIYMFSVWGGLTPPLARAALGGEGISVFNFWHLLLAMGYAAFIFIWLAPSFFVMPIKWLTIVSVSAVVISAAIVGLGQIEFLPMETVVKSALPEKFHHLAGFFFAFAFSSVAFAFIGIVLFRLWERKDRGFILFTTLFGLMVCATALKVATQFSSRYVAQAIPLFLPILAPYVKISTTFLIRMGIGTLLGILALKSYFVNCL